jgi:formate dehydrogenase maturation protein FdhE
MTAAYGEFAKAKELLEAAGYVVLKEKSYRQAQERQRIAEVRATCAEEYTDRIERWARENLVEERRLRDRLTFVYGIAQAHGATTEELSGDAPVTAGIQVHVEAGPQFELSDQDKARMREAMWQR